MEPLGIDFPTYADEEQMIGPFTASEAGIVVGSLFLILMTRQVLVFAALGFVAMKAYKFFKENGSANALFQASYKGGIVVPKSHAFPEPSVREFCE